MPTSLPTDHHVWSCSECQAALDMDPLDELALTRVQMERVNRVFERCCSQGRRGSSSASSEELE